MSHPRRAPFLRAAIRLGVVAAAIAATGFACATITGLGVRYVMNDRYFGFGALGIAIASIMAAYPAGAIAGLFLLRRKPGVQVSLPLGILGCVTGALLTVFLTGALNLILDPSVLFAVYFVSVPVLGAFGYLHHIHTGNTHRSVEEERRQ